jgi:cardiolipin synthase
VPLLLPRPRLPRALRQAARRGVRVRLLLQGKIDYRIAALAAQALYDELRQRRAHPRVHAGLPARQGGVVDDDWATVGSSNIDPLSCC